MAWNWKIKNPLPGMVTGHDGQTSIRKVLALFFSSLAAIVAGAQMATVRHVTINTDIEISDNKVKVIETLPYSIGLFLVFVGVLLGIITVQSIIDFWSFRKFNRPPDEPPTNVNIKTAGKVDITQNPNKEKDEQEIL